MSAAQHLPARKRQVNSLSEALAGDLRELAGYFLVNASDLNEAITIAAQIPSARDGSIEIRPVVAQEKTRQGSQ